MADNQSPELFGQTPWQTVGPFFHYGLPWHGGADLVTGSDLGARPELFAPEHDLLASPRPGRPTAGPIIEISGVVLDGDGRPVPDAMIETWQSDAGGLYAQTHGFPGFGRTCTGQDGVWHLRTLRPGCALGPGNRPQAPHIAVGVFGRGLLKRLVTRIYFDDCPENHDDPILSLVPPERRPTLIARPEGSCWRFDIVLRGRNETVFFDV